MECVAPPELSDGQLLAYLDGEAGATIAAHLARCPACRQRASRLARLLGRVTAALYRLTCPGSTELGEYQLGVLAQSREAAMTTHLAECPHCRAEIVQLQGFLATTARDLELSVVERARVLVARLVGGGARGSALGLAGLRGSGDTPLVYEAGDLQITLTTEVSEQAPGLRQLFGLVIGADLNGARVRLWQDTQAAGEATIDLGGNFVIDDLLPGDYALVIAGADLEVHLEDVPV